MKFGRKSRTTEESPAAEEKAAESGTEVGADVDEKTDATADENADATADAETPDPAGAPRDISEVDVENDGVDRIDLGGMLVAPAEGLELRLQVEEASGEVQSVLIAGPTGAVEVRAFAAPRNGDLWTDVRRQIASETARQGGTATEQEGPHGTELVCRRSVRASDGTTSQQPSRVVGFNGPRWFLRATYLGTPAVNGQLAGAWEAAVASLVVRRGDGPMAPGDQLPIVVPPQARRVG
ncbi:DUF3710 domain-containing protein [Nocardioides sp. Root151]|uniref:DUF3710 domain-containing protein n=1 Tax=Nocardioides sp. Root151 TaxID=1736475 RepID=UPI0007031CC6|nr:DUF3710 domain-containing protein [Nocardioides sp. Root151]KQZ70014.1 hypothetical protein ASD66_10035 [Nocardioides sp. Root151]